MRNILTACLIAAFCAGAARAQEAGELGVGVLLGDPTGATAKYWIDNRHAVDAGIGVSQNLTLHADYLWHAWKALPQPKKGDLGAYLGLGGRLETQSDADFGIRTMLGLSYWPHFKRPVEFFLEIGPVLRLAPDTRVRVDGGFGLRYYFSRAK